MDIFQDVSYSFNYDLEFVYNIKPNAVNVLIEESSKSSTIDIIKNVKTKYPLTKIILILTEF